MTITYFYKYFRRSLRGGGKREKHEKPENYTNPTRPPPTIIGSFKYFETGRLLLPAVAESDF